MLRNCQKITTVIITVRKFQRFNWLQGVQLFFISWFVIYTFLCKQKQKQTLPPKWKKYCAAYVSMFSKAERNRFYSASDSNMDALKQASSSKNTKRSTLSWMRMFNNWK